MRFRHDAGLHFILWEPNVTRLANPFGIPGLATGFCEDKNDKTPPNVSVVFYCPGSGLRQPHSAVWPARLALGHRA